MIKLWQKTADEINKELAERMVKIRKRRKLSQQALAAKSGVSFGSIKRFEQKGEISLQSFTKIAIALEIEEELENLFTDVPFGSIDEIINSR